MSIYVLKQQHIPKNQLQVLGRKVEAAVHKWVEDMATIFGNGQVVWVLMGAAHTSDSETRNHWTIRGFHQGYSKYTIHVLQDAEDSIGLQDGGNKWKDRQLDLEKKCKLLRINWGSGARLYLQLLKGRQTDKHPNEDQDDGDCRYSSRPNQRWIHNCTAMMYRNEPRKPNSMAWKKELKD
ncbi:hypothetical protein JOM56_000639 [Amanita muscaria]